MGSSAPKMVSEIKRRKGSRGGSDGEKKRIKSHFIEKGGKNQAGKCMCVCYAHSQKHAGYNLEARRGYSEFLYHSLREFLRERVTEPGATDSPNLAIQ